MLVNSNLVHVKRQAVPQLVQHCTLYGNRPTNTMPTL